MDSAPLPEMPALEDLAAREPGLELLVLFGSRGRGDARPVSDWDFGYLADKTFHPEAFLGRLVQTLGTERVDLADLERAGALLRFRAAREGRAVHERTPGRFAEFWLAAVHFWCDAGPLIREGYEANLASLRP